MQRRELRELDAQLNRGCRTAGCACSRPRQRADQHRGIRRAHRRAGGTHERAARSSSTQSALQQQQVSRGSGSQSRCCDQKERLRTTRCRRASRWPTSTTAARSGAPQRHRPRRPAPDRFAAMQRRAHSVAALALTRRRWPGWRCGCATPAAQAAHHRSAIWPSAPSSPHRRPPSAAVPAKAMENYRAFPGAAECRSEAARRGAAPTGRPEPRSRANSSAWRTRSRRSICGAPRRSGCTRRCCKAYPDYPRNDQVLYQLARAYETTGQRDAGAGDARSDRAPLSAERARSPKCSSAAASCCSPPSVTPMPRRPTQQVLSKGPQRLHVLRAESLQAWLVAVQAVAERGEPAVVRGAAGSQAGGPQDRQGTQAGDTVARRSRAGRRHAARHEHHVLLP